MSTQSADALAAYREHCLDGGGVFAATIAGDRNVPPLTPKGTKFTTASAADYFIQLDKHTPHAPGTEKLHHLAIRAETAVKPLPAHGHRGNYRTMKGKLSHVEGRSSIPTHNTNLHPLSLAFQHRILPTI